jgi:NAD(P)-dependent dehydrogenase (short-subunit alcohol dehydrogenase family)
MMEMFDLGGTATIVTGAGSGNGRAIALGMAEAGSAVCVADVNVAGANETAALIEDAGGTALALELDVTDRSSVDDVVSAVVDQFGGVHTLVNNAGVADRHLVVDVPESEFYRVIDVNLKGPLLCTQAVVPRMIDAGRGSIINIVSTSAELVSRNISVYAASKGGLKVLTKAMAIELGEYGIRANGICPGFTPTGLNASRWSEPETVERELARIPLGRIGRPEDYSGACVFLASEASSWMTGSMIWIEGGFLSLGT